MAKCKPGNVLMNFGGVTKIDMYKELLARFDRAIAYRGFAKARNYIMVMMITEYCEIVEASARERQQQTKEKAHA